MRAHVWMWTLVACEAPQGDSGADTDPGVVQVDTACNAPSTWHLDADGDGYGDATASVDACVAPPGAIADGSDCDDGDPDANPAAAEVCDGKDDDCDGDVDGPTATDATAWYGDGDGDGYGNRTMQVVACAAPTGYVAAATDCADTDAAVHPGAEEVCGDGLDDDCDGSAGNCDLADASLADADARYAGQVGDQADRVAGAGDVDGDGHDDFLVGAPFNQGAGDEAGAAYLVLGSSSPTSGTLAVAVTFEGGSPSDEAGSDVAGVGDVNGDGFADVAIGAVGWVAGTGDRAGAAYLVLGSATPASRSLLDADAIWMGVERNAYTGLSVAGAGDVDGDGFDDVLVGAPFASDGAGWAAVVLGSGAPASSVLIDGIVLAGEGGDDAAGSDVAGGGDFDGDGYSDLLVGSVYSDDGAVDGGAAYLVFGSGALASAGLSDADAEYTGETGGDGLGCTLAWADLNADGHSDAVIAACYSNAGGYGAGAVYVVLGSSTPESISIASADVKWTGAANEEAGYSLAGPGDVDRDGYEDVLVGVVGSSDASPSAGAADLLLGSSAPGSGPLADADVELTGAFFNDAAGWGVAGAGDADGDGFPDLLIGALEAGQDGAAYLVLGRGSGGL